MLIAKANEQLLQFPIWGEAQQTGDAKRVTGTAGAELGRIRAISLGCSVSIPAAPRPAPLLLRAELQLRLHVANAKTNSCTNEGVWQEGSSASQNSPERSRGHPEGPGVSWVPRIPEPHGSPGSRLGSFSSALVMALATTVSYSIILPKDFQ